LTVARVTVNPAAMPFCEHCGTEGGGAFCGSCGKPRLAQPAPTAGRPSARAAVDGGTLASDVSFQVRSGEPANRTVGFWLGAGILFVPFVFSWFTLRKGHSPLARGLAMGWLVLFILGSAGRGRANHSTVSQATTSLTTSDPSRPASAVNATVAPSDVPAPSRSRPIETTPTRNEGRDDPSGRVTSGGHAFCASLEEFEELTTYVVQNDEVAAAKLLGTGRCGMLKAGIAVEIMDTKVFKGVVKVRPRGSRAAFWTAIEALK
jgi:hypothetical protein